MQFIEDFPLFLIIFQNTKDVTWHWVLRLMKTRSLSENQFQNLKFHLKKREKRIFQSFKIRIIDDFHEKIEIFY